MELSKIKVAILGCGVISDTYMRSIKENFKIIELVGCYDRNDWKMEEKAATYGIKAMKLSEIMEDESIQMIINLTTPAAHYELNKMALEHGKHVYTEKTITVDLAEGKELIELAKKNNLRLGSAPDTFLGGSIQTAKYILDKGLIGKPLSVMVSLNRNFKIFSDLLPHLNKRGGGITFDVGCYYMTALVSLLGPVEKVSAFTARDEKTRIGKRVDKPWFQEESEIAEDGIIAATLVFKSGILCTVHFNSETIIDESSRIEIFGSDGILYMGDPNTFDGPVYLKKPMGEKVQFPFTHGYQTNSRGVGAAEMAWSISKDRPQRASAEMAYHVLEILHGMYLSANSESIYHLESTFEIPKALPEGLIGNGFWGPTEESALV